MQMLMQLEADMGEQFHTGEYACGYDEELDEAISHVSSFLVGHPNEHPLSRLPNSSRVGVLPRHSKYSSRHRSDAVQKLTLLGLEGLLMRGDDHCVLLDRHRAKPSHKVIHLALP